MTKEQYCPECVNRYGDNTKVKMWKIMPLGCPTGCIGGFLWQCPECKTVVADWEELKNDH